MLFWILRALLAAVAAVAAPLDAGLLREALAGNARARRQLAERLAPVIRGRVRRALANWPGHRIGPHDVDDLTSQTWCRLLENNASRLAAYDPATGVSVEGYVSMIAGQLVLNVLEQHRASKRKAEGGMVDMDGAGEIAAPVDAAAAQEARQDLRALWAHLDAQLSERGRAILRLLYHDGCDAETAARTLGVEKQVVYNWQFKIRTLSRAFLGEGA